MKALGYSYKTKVDNSVDGNTAMTFDNKTGSGSPTLTWTKNDGTTKETELTGITALKAISLTSSIRYIEIDNQSTTTPYTLEDNTIYKITTMGYQDTSQYNLEVNIPFHCVTLEFSDFENNKVCTDGFACEFLAQSQDSYFDIVTNTTSAAAVHFYILVRGGIAFINVKNLGI